MCGFQATETRERRIRRLFPDAVYLYGVTRTTFEVAESLPIEMEQAARILRRVLMIIINRDSDFYSHYHAGMIDIALQ
jgi:hypothetical protein